MTEGCKIPYGKTVFCEYLTAKGSDSGYFIWMGSTLYEDSSQGHYYQRPSDQIPMYQITRWRLHEWWPTSEPEAVLKEKNQ